MLTVLRLVFGFGVFAVAGTVVFAIAGVVTGAITGAIAVAMAATTTSVVTVAVAGAVTGAIAFPFAALFTFFCAYVIWQLIQGDYHILGGMTKSRTAKTAAKIQKLLKKLEPERPQGTGVAIDIPPSNKERLVKALKEAGKGAIEEFLDNPYVNITLKIIEGWQDY